MAWTNPVITVPVGSITVGFADGDSVQSHGLELTTAARPYPQTAMMVGHAAPRREVRGPLSVGAYAPPPPRMMRPQPSRLGDLIA